MSCDHGTGARQHTSCPAGGATDQDQRSATAALSSAVSGMSHMLEADERLQQDIEIQLYVERKEGSYAGASPAAPVIRTCLGSDDIAK